MLTSFSNLVSRRVMLSLTSASLSTESFRSRSTFAKIKAKDESKVYRA